MKEDDLLRRVAAKRAQQAFLAAPVKQHPHLKAALEASLNFVHGAPPGRIVIVVGHTGVGKSTLRRQLMRLLVRLGELEAIERPDFFPNVDVELPAPDTIRWSWKDIWLRILEKLVSPLPSSFLRVADMTLRRDEHGNFIVPKRDPGTLRSACESLLRQRRPYATHIDEAQHLLLLAIGMTERQQLEVFKSLANLTETPLVLYGTYDLLDLVGLSAQLDRRCRWIHFAPYAGGAEEKEHFYSAVKAFLNQLPVSFEPPTPVQLETIWYHCAGCVGTAKEWIADALYECISVGAETLTWSHLDHTSPQSPDSSWTELREGLQKLQNRRGVLGDRLIDTADKTPAEQPNNRRRQRVASKLPRRRGALASE